MDGAHAFGRIFLHGDDHFFMGGVLSKLLIKKGCQFTLRPPEGFLNAWDVNTLERHKIHWRFVVPSEKVAAQESPPHLYREFENGGAQHVIAVSETLI